MSEKCSICGKEFDVLYPDIYTYKRGKHWFCRYTCMRQYDKERMTKPMDDTIVKRDRKEVLMAIIEAVKDGKTVDEYLVNAGYKKPGEYYHNLRAWAKKNWPDLYAQLPDRQLKKRGPKPKSDKVRVLNGTEYEKAEPEEPVTLGDAMEEMKAAADKFFGACEDMGLKVNADPKPEEQKKRIMVPLGHSGLRSVGWASDNATYIYDRKHDCITYTDEDGEEICYTVDRWIQFFDEFRRASSLLGVEM